MHHEDISIELALDTQIEKLELHSLNSTLNDRGVVLLEKFLTPELRQALQDEADLLLEAHGRRVDVRVRSTDNTPRQYTTVSRDAVFEHSCLIPQLYASRALIGFLKALTGDNVGQAPFEPEQIVVNLMDQEGDTHGWHWDDYTYSLVLVITAPERMDGARVECVDGTSWDKNAAHVEHYLREKAVQPLDLADGDAYLLLGRRVMHRVSPMLGSGSRKIICFTYASDAERTQVIDHGSMQDIYG